MNGSLFNPNTVISLLAFCLSIIAIWISSRAYLAQHVPSVRTHVDVVGLKGQQRERIPHIARVMIENRHHTIAIARVEVRISVSRFAGTTDLRFGRWVTFHQFEPLSVLDPHAEQSLATDSFKSFDGFISHYWPNLLMKEWVTEQVPTTESGLSTPVPLAHKRYQMPYSAISFLLRLDVAYRPDTAAGGRRTHREYWKVTGLAERPRYPDVAEIHLLDYWYCERWDDSWAAKLRRVLEALSLTRRKLLSGDD